MTHAGSAKYFTRTAVRYESSVDWSSSMAGYSSGDALRVALLETSGSIYTFFDCIIYSTLYK